MAATTAELIDAVQVLDTADVETAEGVKELILGTLKENKEAWLLNAVIDFFLVSHSKRCLTILEQVREPHDKQTFDRLVECIKGQHKLPAITIIGHLVSRPPSWLHKITNHSLMKHVINVMKTETDVPVLVSAVLAVTSLLPIVPVSVQSYIQDILEAFSRLASFNFKKHSQVPEIYLLHLHAAIYSLFHRMYGMFPCHVVYYLRSYCAKKDNQVVFESKIAPMLERVRMHPLLVTASKDKEVSRDRWRQKEVHDIIVDCAKLSLDLIEGSKEQGDFLFVETSTHGPASDSNRISQDIPSTAPGSVNSRPIVQSQELASSMWSPSLNCGLSTPPPGAAASTSTNILDSHISQAGAHVTRTTPYVHESPYPMVEPTTPVPQYDMQPSFPTTPGAANKRLSAMSLSLSGKGPPTPTASDLVPPSPQRFDFSAEPPLNAQKMQAIRKLNFQGQTEDHELVQMKSDITQVPSEASASASKVNEMSSESACSYNIGESEYTTPSSPLKRKRPPPLRSLNSDTFDFGGEDSLRAEQDSAEAIEDVDSSPSVPSVNQLPDIIGNLQKVNVTDVAANDEEVQKLTDSSDGLAKDESSSDEFSPPASATVLTAQSVQAFMKNVKRIRFNSMNVGKLREISQDGSSIDLDPKRSRSNSCPDLESESQRNVLVSGLPRVRSNSGSGSSSSDTSVPVRAKTPTKSSSGISFTAEPVIEEEEEVEIPVTPAQPENIPKENEQEQEQEQEKIQNFLTMYPYHHLFPIALPVAPVMKCYNCRHADETHGRDQKTDEFSLPLFTSYSPPDLLDRHLKLSCEIHADQLTALECKTATSPALRNFGGSLAYPKGLPPADEIKILRGEIQLLHNQVMYERQKRELYAKRNRRLLGKITKATALEEQNCAMQDQLRLKENEVTSLHVTVSLQQKQVHDLKQAKEKLEKEKIELQTSLRAEIMKLQGDKQGLQSIVDAKLRENEAIRREMQSSKSQILNCMQELSSVQEKASFAEELQDQVVRLNKELLLMGELQQKYRQRLASSATMHNPKPEMQFLMETYKQELIATKSQLTQKTVTCDALAAYRAQQDEQMVKKDALIAEQKRMIDSMQAMSQAQSEAAEDKYRAQHRITATLNAHILELMSKLEEYKKPERPAPSAGIRIDSVPETGDELGATGGQSPHSTDSHVEEASECWELSPSDSPILSKLMNK